MTRNDSPGPVARGVTVFGVLLLLAWSALGADVKISDLPETNAPSAIAVSPLVQNGVTWKVQRQNYLGPLTNITQSGSPPVPLWAGGAWPAGADPTWTNGWSRVYNVKLFGAVGNGTADDTAAIQAAIDAADSSTHGGTVFFPGGTYKFSGINLGTTNGQHFISLLGESEVGVQLNYVGPTNGTAITLLSDKYSTLDRFSLNNTSGSTGTTIGVLLTGKNGGTQSNGGIMRLCSLSGWHVAIDAGPDMGYSGTSSEWIFESVGMANGDIGFANFNFNGLNFRFEMLGCANLLTNIWAETPSIFINGGSFSGCKVGVYARNGGNVSIRDVRAESQSGPFVDNGTVCEIANCISLQTNAATNNAVAINGGQTRIIQSEFTGWINATNYLSLDIEDTSVWDTQIAHLHGASQGNATFLRNYQNVGGGQTDIFPDQIQIRGGIGSRAAAFDTSTNLVAATTTLAELNLLSGATSPILSGATGTAGTYRLVSTDAQGRVTAGTNPSTFSGYGISDSSANLATALTDKTGSGLAVFGTSPTFSTSITLTNSSSVTVPITINHAGSASADFIDGNLAGVLAWKVDPAGNIQVPTTLYLGGTSSSFSAVVGSGTQVQLKVANGSAFAALRCNGVSADSAGTYSFNNSDTIISRDNAATVQLGIDSATAISQTLKACDGAGTDKIGANLTLEGGQSSGTATSGSVDISTAMTSEASGNALNAYSIRSHYKPKFVALTDSAATTIETFSLAANKILGGELAVTTYATNSTPHLQCRTTVLAFQAVAVSTTITATIDVVKAGTLAADSGTLTETYSIVDNGNNTFSIQLNAASSITSPTDRCKVVVTALNGNSTVTITDP